MLKTGTMSLADTMFQALKEIEKPEPPLTRSPRLQWMSDSSLSLTYVRSNHRLRADHNQNVARTLKNSVINSLTVDARRIAEVATVGAGEFFWIVQKVHHQVYRGSV